MPVDLIAYNVWKTKTNILMKLHVLEMFFPDNYDYLIKLPFAAILSLIQGLIIN